MKRLVLLSALMLVSIIAWTLPPQGTDDETTSLGTLARELRADRADAAKKPAREFTNDNLSLRQPAEGLPTPAGITSTPPLLGRVHPGGGPAANPAAGKVCDEKCYQEKKAKINAAMKAFQKERVVAPKKLAQEVNHPVIKERQEKVAKSQGAASNLRSGAAPKELIQARQPSRVETQRAASPPDFKKSMVIVRTPGSRPILEVVRPALPAVRIIKPRGYTEKNGQVEALLSEGGRFYVVRVGEAFAGKYKVTKISPLAVEVVDLNPGRSPARPPVVKTLAAQRPPADPTRTPVTPPPVKLDAAVGGQQVNRGVVAKREPTSNSKPLLYVETANRQVQTIVANGDNLRLVPKGSASATIIKLPAASASPAEVARAQVEQASPTGQPETMPVGQPEEVSQPSLPPSSVFQLVTSGSANLPSASMPGQDATIAAGFQPRVSVTPHYVGSEEGKIANPESLEMSPARLSTRPTTAEKPAVLGYVQWANGQVEGIIAEDDEIFMVKEGEVYAENLRALKASPNSVVVGDQSRVPSSERTGQASVPITLTSLGFVESADGDIQAVVVQDDQVYLVRQGDYFAHRFKALSVTASAVVAIDVGPPKPANRITLGASNQVQLTSAKPVAVRPRPPYLGTRAITLPLR